MPSAGSWAWLALPSSRSAHMRGRGAAGRNLDGTPPPEATLLAVYPQISGSGWRRRVTACKTVGLAYVGSNPTPATTHRPQVSMGTEDQPVHARGTVSDTVDAVCCQDSMRPPGSRRAS